MKKLAVYYDNPKQGILPAFFSECLDITDPVFTFDRCMDEIIKGLDKFSKTRFSRCISPTQKRQEAYPIEWSDPMNRAPGWEA